MAIAERESAIDGRPWTAVLHDWVTTVDHKKIGIMYFLMAVAFLVIGGAEALVMRIQLLWPEARAVPADTFNQMMTMHGTTMIFFAVMPILAGVANYIVPLQIGARDMAFPRLNAFGLWVTLFGGILCYFSFATGGRAGHWLVRLCSADGTYLRARPGDRLLDPWPPGERRWQFVGCNQSRHHGLDVALPWHDHA